MPRFPAHWVLALLTLSTLLNYLDRQALAVVVPTLREQIGLSAASYGSVSSAFLIAYSAGQLLAGPIIDRLGLRLGLALFVGFWSLAAMLHGFAQTASHLLLVRVLLGLGEAGNWPAGVKAISAWFPAERRGLYLGIFDGGAAFGSILAFPLMAGLSNLYGWRAAFLAVGSLGLFWLIFWLLSTDASSPQKPYSATPTPATTPLASHPTLWVLVSIRFFATPVWWFYVFWLPDYLAQGRGLTLLQIGLWGWVPYITADLGKWIGGFLSDRLASSRSSAIPARKGVMAAGALLMAAGVFVFDAATAPGAIAWVSLGTFGFGLWSVNILALHADSFPTNQLATAVGITTTAAGIGGAVFTWLTGRIVEAFGYRHAFTLTAAIAITAYLILHFSLRPRTQN